VNIGYRITRTVTPAPSLALVSVDQAKEALGIDSADTSQDAALTAQIDAVSIAINNYCDRVFAVQTYRDQYREVCGNWGEPLVMRQYPLDTTGLVITENGGALNLALVEVWPETGRLHRLDAAGTPSGWGVALLVVDYTAGFDPIPADVQAATLEWLTARWHAIGRDPALRSETIPDLITQVYAGDAGAGTSSGQMPPGARNLLEPYLMWSL
jgi:hypothetical protein